MYVLYKNDNDMCKFNLLGLLNKSECLYINNIIFRFDII